MLRFAIIGAGWWGTELARAAAKRPDRLALAGCYALDDAESRRLTGAFGGQAYSSVAAVLADPAVDAVLLATPHSLHATQIIAVARAGKHAFCEKPFTLTVASGRDAIKACADAKVVLAVGHNRRFMPGARRIKALVDAGELGQVIHVEANYSGSVAGRYPPDHWRVNQAEVPNGGMTPMGLHMIDTLTWILGPIERVVSVTKRQATPYALNDTCAVLFELASGATGLFASNLATSMTATCRLYGDRASVESRANFSELAIAPVNPQAPRTEERFEVDDSLTDELCAFADACAGGPAYPIAPGEALRNIAVLEAVGQSAASGHWVAVQNPY